MNTERVALTDALLKRALAEMAAGPDAGPLIGDVMRTARVTPQERRVGRLVTGRRTGYLLAAALLTVGLAGTMFAFGHLQRRPTPVVDEPSSIAIQRSNGERGVAYATSHLAFAPGSDNGVPLDINLPDNAVGLRWPSDGAHLVFFTREAPPERRGFDDTFAFVADPDGSNPLSVGSSRSIDNSPSNGWWAGAAWAPAGGVFALAWDTQECSGAPDCTTDSGIRVFDPHGARVTSFDTPARISALPIWAPGGDPFIIGWHSGRCAESTCTNDAFHWHPISGDGSVVTLPLEPGGIVTWLSDNRLGVVEPTVQGSLRIYTMAPDGSDQREIAWAAAPDAPLWSPDGSQLAAVDSGRRVLIIHDVVTQTDVTIPILDDLNVAGWSPESDRLVLYGNPAQAGSDAYDLYMVNADGSGGPLSLGDGEDFAWLPESAR